MKKTIFPIALTMSAISLMSYGQNTIASLRFSNRPSAEAAAANMFSRDEVNSKAVKNFLRSFKNASGEKWYKVNDQLIATFTSDNVDYRVDYDKKGNWLHTIRTYDETKMQEDLRHVVKSTYYDYEINLVHEIESPRVPATYIVQLVGKTKLINLRICDGEMEEWQKFDKSE
jgi:hypothetical protein